MLKSFPNTSQYLEDLEVAWIYGVRHFLEDKEDPRDDYIQELKSEIVKLVHFYNVHVSLIFSSTTFIVLAQSLYNFE